MFEQKPAGNAMDRRNFLRNTGYAGLGIAGAAVAASQFGALDGVNLAKKIGLGSQAVEAATLSANDIAVLQFALNLEYLEAEFYCYAVTGKSLSDNGVGIDGIGTAGPTTGGYIVPFASLKANGPLAAVSAQLMRDEVAHVKLIRSVLGSQYTIAKPAIKLDVFGPMNTLGTYLLLSRSFEVAGVSAYGGAVGLLDSTVLQTAAQIALVEALHTGNLQLLCQMNGLALPPLDALDMTPPPGMGNYFDDSLDTALAVIRTPSQVLQLAYQTTASGAASGGFFPAGFNGTITTV